MKIKQHVEFENECVWSGLKSTTQNKQLKCVGKKQVVVISLQQNLFLKALAYFYVIVKGEESYTHSYITRFLFMPFRLQLVSYCLFYLSKHKNTFLYTTQKTQFMRNRRKNQKKDEWHNAFELIKKLLNKKKLPLKCKGLQLFPFNNVCCCRWHILFVFCFHFIIVFIH